VPSLHLVTGPQAAERFVAAGGHIVEAMKQRTTDEAGGTPGWGQQVLH